MSVSTDELSSDIFLPLEVESLRKGWNNLKEECDYWIPPSDVEGTIPEDLRGTFLRNGPGLNEIYGKKIAHPIDGDGMVVALTFVDGRVHLRAKFVRTSHRNDEQSLQRCAYRGEMGTHPNSVLWDTLALLGNAVRLKFPKLQYRNPSNTNVFYWGGKVLTCYETGVPYCIDPFTLNTLGPDNLNGHLQLGCFAAHFRLDLDNDALVCLSLRPGFAGRSPSLAIYEFNSKWEPLNLQMHHIKGMNYAHDFLLLPDYYLLHMTPFVDIPSFIEVVGVLSGLTAPGCLLKYHSHLPSKWVLIPRHSKARLKEVTFIDTDPFHIFHFGTAEQNEDEITFCAVCLGKNFNMTPSRGIFLGNTDVSPGKTHTFRLNLTKKTSHTLHVDWASAEFPTVHPYRHGKNGCRYSYLMASDRKGQNLPYRDIVKFDIMGSKRQVWYSHGCIGEPVFVPRHGWDASHKGEEDDGYLIVQLYVPGKHITEFVILDATDLTKGPLAKIKLKHHIPYGFHGTFTPEVFIGKPSTYQFESKL